MNKLLKRKLIQLSLFLQRLISRDLNTYFRSRFALTSSLIMCSRPFNYFRLGYATPGGELSAWRGEVAQGEQPHAHTFTHRFDGSLRTIARLVNRTNARSPSLHARVCVASRGTAGNTGETPIERRCIKVCSYIKVFVNWH